MRKCNGSLKTVFLFDILILTDKLKFDKGAVFMYNSKEIEKIVNQKRKTLITEFSIIIT